MSAFRFRVLPPSGAPLGLLDILATLGSALDGRSSRDALSEKLRRIFGVRHVFLYSSGRAGLSAGLRALQRLNPGRTEVLLPAYTSFSVPSAVVNAGLEVALYDLDPETLAPDLGSLEAALNERTLCVVACHLFGYPVNLAPLRALCQRHGCALLDDAAQAMGASLEGRLVGTQGDFGLFSLSRGKNITAVDGGILVTDRDDLAQGLEASHPSSAAAPRFTDTTILAKSLLLMGCLHPRLYWLPASLPFLNIGASVFDPVFPFEGLRPLQAGLALRALDRLHAINVGRRAVAERLLSALTGAQGVRLVRPAAGAVPVFLRLPLLPAAGAWDDGRVPVLPHLGVVRSYPLALHRIPGLAPFLTGVGSYPVAEMLAANLITLPTHAHVAERDIQALAGAFRELEPCGRKTAMGGAVT